MSNNFNFLSGFFFYKILARKMLINKFIFLSEKNVPDVKELSLFFSTNQKESIVSDSSLFSILTVFEFLTTIAATVKKCDEVKLDHFTKLQNVKISSDLFSFKKYEFFLNMHCFWFQGLHKTYDILKTKNKLKTNTEKTRIEYLRYNAPVYSKKSQKRLLEEKSYFRNIEWKDFTFCNFIPVALSNNLMQQNINVQIGFNSKNTKQINMLLSSLSFNHKLNHKKNEI